LTRRWRRDGFDGYAPGMAGHLVATYHSADQHCAWTCEGRRLSDRLRQGVVTVVAEGHDGDWLLGGPVMVSHVYLTQQRLLNSAVQLGTGRRVEVLDRVGFDDPVLARILEALSDNDLLDDPAGQLLIERGVDLVCLQLLRRHIGSVVASTPARGGLAQWRLRRVTDYMLMHLDRPVGLDELAAQAQLSRYHFCTAFRIATGRTPHVWLTEQRMARARRLLADPTLSVSEIALAVGYATPSAFATSFRRMVGMTPSDYRRAL
jgi:AraC family transcriptional regulator